MVCTAILLQLWQPRQQKQQRQHPFPCLAASWRAVVKPRTKNRASHRLAAQFFFRVSPVVLLSFFPLLLTFSHLSCLPHAAFMYGR